MDNSYWANELPHPLAPSIDDAQIYKDYMYKGTTLLLGCTHKLIPFSTKQMDIDPWYKAETMIVKDWRENTEFYDNIIGDGVLNFSKELTDHLLVMCAEYCRTFIARSFHKKLPQMKIANYFPQFEDFEFPPVITEIRNDYNFYIWNFSYD